MSTLSATQLPARKMLVSLQATLVGVTLVNPIPMTSGCVVSFDLYAKGLTGQSVTVMLLPTSVPASFSQLFPYTGLQQSFTLIEGNRTCNFTITGTQYQVLLGQQLYILVSCYANNRQYWANTNNFNLTPPVVQPCDGGAHLGTIFERLKFKGKYGPAYEGSSTLTPDSQSIWDTLISTGQATENDKKIICVAAGNEGKFDTVQSYDGQVLSVGILQKTIRPGDSQGELNKQLYEFQQAEPVLFDCYLGRHGWQLDYQGTSPFRCDVIYTKNGIPYKRDALRIKILEATDPLVDVETKNGRTNSILRAFVLLGRLPEFQNKQVRDAVARVHEVLDREIRPGIKVRDYFKSAIGQALVYDQHVNAKSNVVSSVRAAVAELMSTVPGLNVNPATWGTNHEDYERKLIPIYGIKRQMTAAEKRYKDIKSGFYDKYRIKL